MVIFLYNLYTFCKTEAKQKCIDYVERWPFLVIFLYTSNLHIFVWI